MIMAGEPGVRVWLAIEDDCWLRPKPRVGESGNDLESPRENDCTLGPRSLDATPEKMRLPAAF